MLKLIKNKKGQVITVWAQVLIFLFALGILFSVFLFIFQDHLIPVLKNLNNNSATVSEASKTIVNDGIDKYMTYFKLMPFVLVLVAIIYGIVSAIYKNSGGQYQ